MEYLKEVALLSRTLLVLHYIRKKKISGKPKEELILSLTSALALMSSQSMNPASITFRSSKNLIKGKIN